jgi:hypothetical protein
LTSGGGGGGGLELIVFPSHVERLQQKCENIIFLR